MESRSPSPNPVNLYDSSINPREVGYLSFTPIVDQDTKEWFLKVKTPGDGNCGFYSFGLGLINLIVQNKLSMTDERFSQLLALWQDEEGAARDINKRLDFYITGQSVDNKRVQLNQECITALLSLRELFNQNKILNFNDFKSHLLKHNNYYSNMAMVIFLAPMLRQLSIKIAFEHGGLNEFDTAMGNESAKYIELQSQDGLAVESGQLRFLAALFDIEFTLFDDLSETQKNIIKRWPQNHDRFAFDECKEEFKQEPESNHTFPANQISVVLKPGTNPHFDFLLSLNDYASPPFYFSEFDIEESNDEINAIKKEITLKKIKLMRLNENIDELKQKVGDESEELKNLIKTLRSQAHEIFTHNEKVRSDAIRKCKESLESAKLKFPCHEKSLDKILINLLQLCPVAENIQIESASSTPNENFSLLVKIETLPDSEFKEELRNLNGDLQLQPYSSASAIIQYTHTMLDEVNKIISNESRDSQDKEKALKAIMENYYISCQSAAGSEKTMSSVLRVVLTGIGFILGVTLGAGIGFLAGTWSGFGAAYTVINGVTSGAAIGATIGATAAGLATRALSRHPFFKPVKLDERVKLVVTKSNSITFN